MLTLNDQVQKPAKSLDLSAWVERISTLAPAHSRLRVWQKLHGRHGLAWQKCDAKGFRDPYRVWLSEVMLQQTQVTIVVSYFDRFLEAFPSVVELAAASQEEVFALWSGLGYYRRARFLHDCAKAIVARHGSQFPRDTLLLAELPGVGKTTAAAIASFCFGTSVSIFDGNVERVVSRLFAFEADLSSQTQRNTLWALAETLLPTDPSAMPWHTQALMDLGATVCKPKLALCSACPLATLCGANSRLLASPEMFPVKSRKVKRSTLENVWLWLESGDRVWLEQRPLSGLWGGLWSLPLLDGSVAREFFDRHSLLALAGQPFKHVLTHRDWILHPVFAEVSPSESEFVSQDKVLGAGRWFDKSECDALGVSGPTKVKLACWQADGLKKRLETSAC